MSKSRKLTSADILSIVQARSEWSARATSVANPERVSGVTVEGKLVDASGTVLRAYVNASGVAMLETNAEYKIRKNIRSEAKTARKISAPPVAVAVASPAPAGKVKKGKKGKNAPAPAFDATAAQNAPSIADALRTLQAAGVDVSGLTVATPAPDDPAYDETGATPSATKNATIRAIDNKLATLGKDRAYVEAQAGFALTAGSVRALREVNRILGERIAKAARKNS